MKFTSSCRTTLWTMFVIMWFGLFYNKEITFRNKFFFLKKETEKLHLHALICYHCIRPIDQFDNVTDPPKVKVACTSAWACTRRRAAVFMATNEANRPQKTLEVSTRHSLVSVARLVSILCWTQQQQLLSIAVHLEHSHTQHKHFTAD